MPHSGKTTPESRRAQGRMGALKRNLGADHPETVRAQEVWRSEAYIAAIHAAVADAPPLTPEQRSRIAAILRPVTIASGTEAAA